MLNVEGTNFNGTAYITNDKKGTWVWDVKPVLKDIGSGLGWYLPEEFQGNGMSLRMEQVNGGVLPVLLNISELDYNDFLRIYDKPRIFKITLSEVEDEKAVITD